MKFTIKDQADDSAVKMDLVKHPQNRSMSLLMDETREKVADVSARKGKITISINPDLASSGAMSDVSSVTTEQAPSSSVNELRNWEWDNTGKVMTVIHPSTGAKIELMSQDPPGPETPKYDVKDILGQPDMTFATAYSLASSRHSMLIGPTGTGKTSMYRWFARQLGWNFVLASISRGTEAAHLVGDYLPTGQALFEWMDGPVTEAIRLSQKGPTLLVFDEINRIGNIAEFSRIYPVLDDTRALELKERRDPSGAAERLECGQLMIGATANPSDDEAADYMGVQDLDPALSSRFGIQPTVSYPSVEVELEALVDRVPSIGRDAAYRMVKTAKKIRESSDVRFPISFRELENWAAAHDAFGYAGAARVAVINKAPRVFHTALESLIKLT